MRSAATVTLPRSRAAASGDATITAAEVESALSRLDALIEDGMAQTGGPDQRVAVVPSR